MDYVALGKRIRSERKVRKHTQEELSEMVGISLSFLGHIERGSRKASIETLIRIANTLNISIDYLLQDSLSSVQLSSAPYSFASDEDSDRRNLVILAEPKVQVPTNGMDYFSSLPEGGEDFQKKSGVSSVLPSAPVDEALLVDIESLFDAMEDKQG